MLDLKFIRENAAAVVENCKNRGVEADVGLVVELADRRSALIGELNELRQQQNQKAKSIGGVKESEARPGHKAEARAGEECIPQGEGEIAEEGGGGRAGRLQRPN